MKLFISLLLLISASSWANEITSPGNPKVGSPPNASSRGTDTKSGISESPAGTTEREEERFEDRPASMGGAPNAGGGMGTGTGAGSTVGNEVDEGNITAGATSGEENE